MGKASEAVAEGLCEAEWLPGGEEEALRWIDLREDVGWAHGEAGQGADARVSAQRSDARVLAASVLGPLLGPAEQRGGDAALPGPVLAALTGVPGGAAAYAALAAAVSDALFL